MLEPIANIFITAAALGRLLSVARRDARKCGSGEFSALRFGPSVAGATDRVTSKATRASSLLHPPPQRSLHLQRTGLPSPSTESRVEALRRPWPQTFES